jgi:hypothetical protein
MSSHTTSSVTNNSEEWSEQRDDGRWRLIFRCGFFHVCACEQKEGSRQLHMFQIDQGQLEAFSDQLHGLIELPLERLLPVPASVAAALSSPVKGSTAAASAAGTAAGAGHTKSPPPVATPSNLTAAASSPSSAAGGTSSSSSVAASLAPATAATSKLIDVNTLNGEALRQHIILKTSVANRFLSNLVEAADGGQYVDLTLTRLNSI